MISAAVQSNPRPANVPIHASDESDDGNQTEENYVRENPGGIKTDDSVIKKKKDGLTKGISQAELDLRTGSFIEPFNRETGEERSTENVEETPSAWTASPRISERDKGKALSVEEKWGTGKVVNLSSRMSGLISQEQECSDNFKDDNTGKLLPITFEKQRGDIPTIEVNIDAMANIIFLDRDCLEEADPRIPNQQETSLPASSSGSSNQGEESQPEGQENTKIDGPKKRKWFKPFSWWQKR